MAKAAGLVIAIHGLLWIGFRVPFRRVARPPWITLHLFALSLSAWTAGRVFFSSETWVNHLGAALIFATSLFLWALIDRFVCGAWLAQRRNIHIPIIIRQMGGALIVLAAGASILKLGYHLELTGLLATSGIAAVILGFAMQDLLSNVIAGFSIHSTGAYRVGDWLLLGDKGDRAEVTEINWRSTRLVNSDDVSFELPNSDIVKHRIVNLNYPKPEHAVRLRFGLDYDVPPAMAKQALLAATAHAKGIIESPAPSVILCEFGDHSVIYELRVWMRHAGLYNVACDDIRTALWYELKRRDIRIPYPVRSLESRKSNEPGYFVDAKARAAEIVAGKALNCLTPEEARTLVASGVIILFGPNESLVNRGDAGNSMFVVLNGSVQVVGKSDAGTQIVLANLGSGEYFGETSLLTGEPRNASVRAETDTLVLEIRKKDISPLIEANPALAVRLGELLERRQTERQQALQGTADHPESAPSPRQTLRLSERIRIFFSNPTN